jgi:invasion protein IalB
MRMLPIVFAVAALAAFAMLVPRAAAQQSTSATYDDWVLVCNNTAGPPPAKTCQIASMTMVQGKNTPFSRIDLEKASGGKSLRLVAQVPVNVSVRSPMIVKTDDADPGISAAFDRCVPGGCFAEFDLKEEMVKKLRAAEGAGKMIFKDAAGADIAVPISFKGFRTAFDAFAKE